MTIKNAQNLLKEAIKLIRFSDTVYGYECPYCDRDALTDHSETCLLGKFLRKTKHIDVNHKQG